jgi:hypothetical protein
METALKQGPGTAGLKGSLGKAGLALVVACAAAMPPAWAAGEEEESSPSLGRWERVRVKMEARGELFAPTGDDSGEVRRPFNAAARLDFLEAVAEANPAEAVAAAPPRDARGVRHFFSAASELSLDRDGDARRSLAPATTTLVVASSPTVTHFAPDALLTREESELLAIAFDPLLLDQLLPPADSASAEWRPSGELVAALLVIDTVGRPVDDQKADPTGDSPDPAGPLLARVEPAADSEGSAKLLVTGTVHGAVDGVPTTIRVDGSYELDAAGRRIKSGVVRLREKRLAGHVSPGFECEASFQMARRPAEGSQAVPAADAAVLSGMEAAWARVLDGQRTAPRRSLRFQDPDRRFALIHDARWRAVADDARGLVLRMVDDGALLAECTVLPLPPGEAGMSIEAFRRDIERSLAGRLDRFTASEEQPSAESAGRALRVVSEGTVDGVPLEWRHYLVEDGRGSRTAVTFTVERRFADRFGRADADFMAGLNPKTGPAP